MKYSVLISCLLAVLTSTAADYSNLYTGLPTKVKQVEPVVIPSAKAALTDFGAKGDGRTLCTDAFRQGLESLVQKGGGTLEVPMGVWLTGPIEMLSNTALHLDQNAIIIFSPDKSLFRDPAGKTSRYLPCIYANGRENIAITGNGIIDGNGANWRPVKRGKVSDDEWKTFAAIGGVERNGGQLWLPWDSKAGFPNIEATPEKQESRRNDLVRFQNCRNVLFQGCTFQNSPRFHVHPINSANVIADHITVRCPWNAQNGDGIDFGDVHTGLITGCTVNVGDDGICMKSGAAKGTLHDGGCQDILIQDNTVYHAHGGFVIGSEFISGMRDIVVRRCRFAGTDTGLRFKSALDRGGTSARVYIEDIMMTDIKSEAIVFHCDYENKPANAKSVEIAQLAGRRDIPHFQDIHISRVVCRGTGTAIAARGIEGLECVKDITLQDVTILYNKEGMKIEPTAQLTLRNVVVEKIGK